MSSQTPQQDFWRAPRHGVEGIGELTDEYLKACLPSNYLLGDNISAALANVIGLYQMPPAKILELGCGPGRNLFLLSKRGYQVSGIEINPDSFNMMELNYLGLWNDKDFHLGAVEDVLPELEPVPIILTSGFLMHVPYYNPEVISMIPKKFTRYLFVNEVEGDPGADRSHPEIRFYRWYESVFELQGLEQVGYLSGMQLPPLTTTTIRVFRHRR